MVLCWAWKCLFHLVLVLHLSFLSCSFTACVSLSPGVCLYHFAFLSLYPIELVVYHSVAFFLSFLLSSHWCPCRVSLCISTSLFLISDNLQPIILWFILYLFYLQGKKSWNQYFSILREKNYVFFILSPSNSMHFCNLWNFLSKLVRFARSFFADLRIIFNTFALIAGNARNHKVLGQLKVGNQRAGGGLSEPPRHTDAISKKEQSRLFFLRRLRSFEVVCYRSSITADQKRLDKWIKKSSSETH